MAGGKKKKTIFNNIVRKCNNMQLDSPTISISNFKLLNMIRSVDGSKNLDLL